MPGAETLILIGKAKRGDREAWTEVLQRYYDRWLRKYHGDLGSTVRRLYDTQDIVQSAVGDALRDIPRLESEAAFFSWVTSIIRHKVAQRRRELKREAQLEEPGPGGLENLGDTEKQGPDSRASNLDSYVRTLEVMLELFPKHPEPMAAVNMMFLEGCSVEEIIGRFGKSRSSVYRWLRTGIELLKMRMDP
jgi:RNA polymerase sigma factor (sigma-70 family)